MPFRIFTYLHIYLSKKTNIMKSKILLIAIAIAFAFNVRSASSQGFQPPAEGKAVVYIVRLTSYGFAISFEYFHNDKYIGAFKGKNYMRYECDPGKQLIWISSENKEFIECDLKAGGSYIILVNLYPGVMKARMESTPINVSDERFKEIKDFIVAEAPVVTPQEKIDAANKKLAKFIGEQLSRYNAEIKGIKEVDQLTADMAIPEESMK
jgi:hypothetical protein